MIDPASMLSPLRVRLDGNRSYAIHFRSLEDVPALMKDDGLRTGRCIIVSDTHVATLHAKPLHAALVAADWVPYLHVVPAGESSKSNDVLQALYDDALRLGIDRTTPMVALGGGVVGDLAGFAAATLLRGLPLVQIPTTLIAQVDSAIGGKTGINHPLGKNLIGAFYQPRFVCVAHPVLATLPEREWRSGLAEVLKHALIADEPLFERLERSWPMTLEKCDPSLIRSAAAIKVSVVSEDEHEAGRRALLNFGHTFGHAIERVAGYGRFTHGEAVAVGMRAALFLSSRRHADFPLDRADTLVRGLAPGNLSALPFPSLFDAMQTDKKMQAGIVRFVLLRTVGNAYLCDDVQREELEAAWDFARTY